MSLKSECSGLIHGYLYTRASGSAGCYFMEFQAYLVVALVLVALVGMASNRVPAELALIAVLMSLLLGNVISAKVALGGFASESLHTVALLFVVSAGLSKSGGMALLARVLLGQPRKELAAHMRIVLPAAMMSTVLNNTPIVAMMIPVVRDWARKYGIVLSKVLIPLSFASILGGMCTLIGSSTNLVVYGLLPEHLRKEIGFFTVGIIGAPAAILGIVYLLTVGRRLLPLRKDSDASFEDPRAFTTEVIVMDHGPLVGLRLGDIQSNGNGGLHPVEIDRRGNIVVAPGAEELLEANDRLVLAGPASSMVELHRIEGLMPAPDPQFHDEGIQGKRQLFELVISAQCPLVGHTVGDGSFRRRYQAAVLAVARHGETVAAGGVSGWRLQAGDTVMVAANRSFQARNRNNPDFILITDHIDQSAQVPWHPALGVGIMLVMVGLAATEIFSMFEASLAATFAFIGLRVLSWNEAIASLQSRVLLTIAAALSIGAALESTGATKLVVEGLLSWGGRDPTVTMILLYIATVFCTEVVTNNAAAVIMIPFALASSQELGVNPMAAIVAVMIGASASFSTPIGYQTNLMVYGPGGYRFSDYLRVGVPLSVLIGALTLYMAPIVWPWAP